MSKITLLSMVTLDGIMHYPLKLFVHKLKCKDIVKEGRVKYIFL